MKFIINKEVFAKGLSAISKAIAAKDDLEQLSQFINIEAKKDKITLSSFDGESFQMRAIIDDADFFTVETEGTYAAPGKHLHALISSYPVGNLRVEFEKNKQADDDLLGKFQFYRGEKKTKKNRHSLVGCQVPWSDLKYETKGTTVSINADRMLQVISRTHFAASTEQFRGVLQGIMMKFSKDGATFIATDGRRLSHCTLPDVSSTKAVESLLPASVIRNFSRSIEKGGELVTMTVASDRILFSQANDYGRYETIIIGYEDQYVPYQKILDMDRSQTSFVIDTAKLADVINRISAINPEDADFHFEDGTVAVKSAEAVGDYEEECPITEFDGDSVDVAMTLAYVKELISVANGELVTAHIGDSESPIEFKVDGEFTFYIMPLSREEVAELPEEAEEEEELATI